MILVHLYVRMSHVRFWMGPALGLVVVLAAALVYVAPSENPATSSSDQTAVFMWTVYRPESSVTPVPGHR